MLAEFVTTAEPSLPLLPLVHTTDLWNFRKIMSSDRPAITPSKCKYYDEALSYFFYGVPCYRANASIDSVSLSALYSVCLILRPDSIPPPYRIMPFDSGAMHNSLFKEYLHPKMTVGDFELYADLNEAAKLVNYFYGSNKDYCRGKAKPDVKFSPLDLEVDSLLAIIQARAQTRHDERRSAVEVQLTEIVSLSHETVMAVILPESLLDQDRVVDFIEKQLGAHPIGYFCTHARPSDDARSIETCAFEFYKSRYW